MKVAENAVFPPPVHAPKEHDENLDIWPSQVATIMGLNPWQTPLQLWYEKTGRKPRPDLSDNESIEMGMRLEGLIADVFAEREHVKIRRKNETIVHSSYPFWRGKIDREVLNQPVRSLLECKNASEYQLNNWGESGTDQVPDYYAVQVHSYFPCGLGYDVGYLAVLLGGRTHRRYRIERDPEIEDLIELSVLRFRQHLLNDTHPEPINSADMERLYPDALEDCIEATEDVLKDVSKLRRIQNRVKELNDAKTEISERLKMVIGPHAGLMDAEGTLLNTWKTQTFSRLDTKSLKAKHPKLAKQFTTTGTQRRFLIK